MNKPEITVWMLSSFSIPIATAECYGLKKITAGLEERVIKQGHLAILRHGFASVSISNISRICGRQLLRKAHADYMERSQRYYEEESPRYILPDAILELASKNTELYKKVFKHNESATKLYKALRKAGIKKEDARYIYPQSIETSITMSGNLQMWWDFFNLRIDKRVQAETCEVAKEILRKFIDRDQIFKLHPKAGEV